jgi:hypothetical protein
MCIATTDDGMVTIGKLRTPDKRNASSPAAAWTDVGG